MLRSLLALALLLPTSACDLYGGGDDDIDHCVAPAGEGAIAPLELRNPETGQCEDWTGYGDYCPPGCEPCPAFSQPLPTWGYCDSHCTGLPEDACLSTSGCRGGYLDVCPPNADCDLEGSLAFYECWAVDQTGPIEGDECWGLDAYECSRHSDCRSVHQTECWNYEDPAAAGCVGSFSFCVPESEAPPTCGELGEHDCIGRDDCDPFYIGIDCSCDSAGCGCAEWQFDSCQPMDGTTDV